MRCVLRGLLLLGFCFSSGADAHVLELKKHVSFLSSEALEGRMTGTLGEQIATQYAANLFARLGLEPAGDEGSFFQNFQFIAGVDLGEHNAFSIVNQVGEKQTFQVGDAWRPLAFSDNLVFETSELVFAGYGITAPALNALPAYDTYHDLDVRNKYVVVFRYLPEKISEEQKNQLRPYASLRYKAFTAKSHGARGIIFVSGPNSKVREQLVPLKLDTSLSGSDMLAISVRDEVVDSLLKLSNAPLKSLKALQDKLDSNMAVEMPVLKGIHVSGQVDLLQSRRMGRNVLARLKLSMETSSTLLIGAHVDHLGHGELGASRESDSAQKRIHYGADDNASGVATVLQSAVCLSQLKSEGQLKGNKDILFAIWSGEELGFIGSSYFVKNLMQQSSNQAMRPTIELDINLDMVGRLREKLLLQGVASSSRWPKLIEQVNRAYPMSLGLQDDPYLPTDSTPFYMQGVPILNFFTGAHDEYHTSRDKPETLNYVGMARILSFLVEMIKTLELESGFIDYQHVPKTGDKPSRGLRVYLGTIPDYTSMDIQGVKVSGVAKNSPAERAGIRAGDVIFELAGQKIHDIYEYTFTLNTLQVGEPVTLMVRRNNVETQLVVVAQSRE